ncbi:unnamed protein product [Discosporangium mesarthrocarpum]
MSPEGETALGDFHQGGGWRNDGPQPSDGLRLDGVSFTHPGRSTPTLDRVGFQAGAGSVVMVLGGAGAGKVWKTSTTLGV